jgi:hypothetical protein
MLGNRLLSNRGRPGFKVDLAAITAQRVVCYLKRFDESVPATGYDDLYDHDVVDKRLVLCV